MIEGVLNIEYILEKEERIKDWFDYSAIYNNNVLKNKKKYHSFVSEEDEKEISERKQDLGEKFKRKGRKDSFYPNFRGSKTLSDIAQKNAALTDLYAGYQSFSDWAHWGCSLNIFSPDNREINYCLDHQQSLLPALLYAYQTLLVLTQITNNHFKIGYEEELLKISKDFIDSFLLRN